MLPLALKLENKRVLVIGAGKIAAAKIKLCLEQGADVRVIAREVLVDLPESVSVEVRSLELDDLEGAHLIVAATGDAECNAAVWRETRRTGQWLNVVDNPSLCDLFFTAVHRVGDIVISVSSQGTSPAIAKYVRDGIAASLSSNLGELTAAMREERERLHQQGDSTERIDWRSRINDWLAANPTASANDAIPRK